MRLYRFIETVVTVIDVPEGRDPEDAHVCEDGDVIDYEVPERSIQKWDQQTHDWIDV